MIIFETRKDGFKIKGKGFYNFNKHSKDFFILNDIILALTLAIMPEASKSRIIVFFIKVLTKICIISKSEDEVKRVDYYLML